MTIPVAATSPGPPPAPAAVSGARRAGADRGGDFASLLGAVAERNDAPEQERLDRAAPQQRGAQHWQERDHDDRTARHDAAGRDDLRRDRAADRADRAADRAERTADRRERAAGRDAATDRDEVRRDAGARRRDEAVAHAERASLRRQGAEQAPADEAVGSSERYEDEAVTSGGTPSGDGGTTAAEASATADAVVHAQSQEAPPQVAEGSLLSGLPGAAALLGSTSQLASPLVQPAGGGPVAGLLATPGGVPEEMDQTGLGAAAVDGELAGAPAPVLVGDDLTAGTPLNTAQSAPAKAQAQAQPAGGTAATEGGAGTGTIDLTFLDAAGSLPGATSPAVTASGSPGQTAQAVTSAGLVDDGAAVDPALPAPATDDAAVTPLPGPGVPGTRAEPALAPLGLADRASGAEPASAADALLRTNIGATVADLARAAHRDGSGATRVVIRLDPPELGTVTVALTVRGGEVRVTLLASDVAAVAALDARRTDIDHALADSGLSLDSFDVQPDSRQGQEQQHRGQDRASAAGRPWRALGPEMDWERAAAVDRAARGVWL